MGEGKGEGKRSENKGLTPKAGVNGKRKAFPHPIPLPGGEGEETNIEHNKRFSK